MAETFRLKCECGTTLTIPVSAVGRIANCQTCGHRFTVPYPEASSGSADDVQSIEPPADEGPIRASASQHISYQCTNCGTKLNSLGSLGGAEEYCVACGTANRIPGTPASGRGAWPGGVGPPRVCDYCRKCLADPAISSSRRFAAVLERKDGLILRRQNRSTPICRECAAHLRVMSAVLAVGSVVGIIVVGIAWALVFPDGLDADSPDGVEPVHVVMSLVLGFGIGVLCVWAYAHMSGMRLAHYWSGPPSRARMRRDKWRCRRRGSDAGQASGSRENARTAGEFLTQALKGSHARISIELKELPGIWAALTRQIEKAHAFLTKGQAPELAIQALELECAMCRQKYPRQAIGGIISACIARQTAADKTAVTVPSAGGRTPVSGRCPECGNRMVAIEFNPGRLVLTEYEDPLLQAAEAKPRGSTGSRQGPKR